MRLAIQENKITFTPDTQLERTALEMLRKAMEVKVEYTDPWSDTDVSVDMTWAKDD